MQAAVEALLLVVQLNGPTMMARIGVMRALNWNVERVFDPSRKDKHWGPRKLAPLLGGFSFRAREGPSPTASSHSCRDQPGNLRARMSHGETSVYAGVQA